MPECYRHGPYSGTRCHRCEVEAELKRSRQQAEDAEREAAGRERRERDRFEEAEREAQIRYREAEEAADYRASQLAAHQRELAAHQRELVEKAHTIQAESLCQRAQQLLKAGLLDEAVETSRDSITKDRAYLPAYTLLGAAEYDRGNRESAVQALGKAIRLLGTGEWTDERAYIDLLSCIEGREFPEEIITGLRSKASGYSGRTTVNLLKWLASLSWSREVMQLLAVDKLSAKELISVASFLVNGRDPAAGGVLVSEAVRKLKAQSKVDPSFWLDVTHWAMDVEVKTGDGASRLASFDLAAGWPPDLLFTAISELPNCKEWKALPELKAGALRGMLALSVAPILNARENECITTASDSVQAPSAMLAWIPAVTARDTEARHRAQTSARQSFRQTTLSWVGSSILRDLINIAIEWAPSAGAHQLIQSYLGEVEHWRAWRLKEVERFADAALAFSKARDRFHEGGNLRHEQTNAYWHAWCLYSCEAWEAAVEGFAAATQLAQRLDDPKEIGAGLYWQAMCFSASGNPSRDTKRAISLYQAALDAAQAVAATSWVPTESLRKIAELSYPHEKPGDYTAALASLWTALKLDRQSKDTNGQIVDLFELGCCHKPSLNTNGDWSEAIALLSQANEIAATTNNLVWQAKCTFHIGWCLEPSENPHGDWETAISHHKRAAELAHLAEHDELEAEALNAVGWCYQPVNAPSGDWELARSWCERALAIWRRTQNPARLATALFNVGKSMAKGDCGSVTPKISPLFREAARLYNESNILERALESEAWAEGKTRERHK